MLVVLFSQSNIYVKSPTEENAIANEILKLPNSSLEVDKPVKVSTIVIIIVIVIAIIIIIIVILVIAIIFIVFVIIIRVVSEFSPAPRPRGASLFGGSLRRQSVLIPVTRAGPSPAVPVPQAHSLAGWQVAAAAATAGPGRDHAMMSPT